MPSSHNLEKDLSIHQWYLGLDSLWWSKTFYNPDYHHKDKAKWSHICNKSMIISCYKGPKWIKLKVYTILKVN